MSDAKIEESLPTIVDRQLPGKWSYDESAARARTLAGTWRSITANLLREWWVAREMLRAQGARTDLDPGSQTWENWCAAAGVAVRTASRWLARYDETTGEIAEPQTVTTTVELPPTSGQLSGSDETPEPPQPPVRLPPVALPPTPESDTDYEPEPDIATPADNPPHVNFEAVLNMLARIEIPDDLDIEHRALALKVAKAVQRRAGLVVRKLVAMGADERTDVEKRLYSFLRQVFESKNELDFNFKVQGSHMWDLVERATKRGDEAPEWLAQLVATFYRLVSSEDKFWKGTPFLPNSLNSESYFPRVTKAMDESDGPQEGDEEFLQAVMAGAS